MYRQLKNRTINGRRNTDRTPHKPEKQQKMIDYAKDKTGINFGNGTFKISSETDLKNLLYAMDQRYYYADIYEENRVANSVRVV